MPGATFNVPSIGLANTTWAAIQLLNPADYKGEIWRCDDCPGGGGMVYCNGTNFQPFSRAVQAKALQTDASGVASWVFDPAFPVGVVPVITIAVVNSGAQEVAVSMTSQPTNTGVSFTARASRSIPQNLATLLLSAVYAVFQTGSAAANVPFHVTARIPTSS